MKPFSAFQALLAEMPEEGAYPGVDTLVGEADRLAAEFPDTCSARTIGASRSGTPIKVLTIGDGPFQALLVGLPHPDEPIGSLMLRVLARRLASDPDLTRDLQFTWHIVFAADPDGGRLNEGWFRGPFTPGHFGRHYYRPIESDQFEWSFPIRHKKLDFQTPLPEAKAVADLVASTPIDYLANLHNCTVGGAYLYLSHPARDLHEPFYQAIERAGIPPHRGQPEVPYLQGLDGDAVYRSYGSREVYDFYESTGHEDPCAFIEAGTCLDEHVVDRWDAFTLVCELPYFTHPDVASRERCGDTRLGLLEKAWADERPMAERIRAVFEAAKPHLSDSPFARVLDIHARTYVPHREAELKHAATSAAHRGPATVAEAMDARVMRGYDHLFLLGQAARMLALDAHRAPHVLEPLLAQVEEAYETHLRDLGTRAAILAPTPTRLARCMLEMVLRGALHARDSHRRGRPRGARVEGRAAWERREADAGCAAEAAGAPE